MKNLLIFISPTNSFDNPRSDLSSNDAGPLVKVQIENSLALGWNKEDILIVTNFTFQYGEFKSHVTSDVPFFERKPQASKINTIIKLFEEGLIKDKELYWFHDLDAFQLQPITEQEIGINNNEIALTDYGGRKYGGEDRWSTGSIFFRKGSRDIFYLIQEVFYKKNIDEEEALGILTKDDPKIRKRVKKVNNTYNFIGYNLKTLYSNLIKPPRVVHFHPLVGNRWLKTDNSLDFFLGNNPLNVPLVTERLAKILKYHRIRTYNTYVPKVTVAISIPTYKRADRILRVYENAKNSSPLVTNVYFIVEEDDTHSIATLRTHHLNYFINERKRGAVGAHNTAFKKTKEKYFFTGSDDFDFKTGWLEECLEKMTGSVKVVGVNDLHNPDVVSQKYALQFFIDREYIEKRSGVFDESNLILSETYHHNWADREFFDTAKARGVFAFAPKAHVEHLHWTWGLSSKDRTYKKQNGTNRHDSQLYLQRKALLKAKIKSELR